MTSAGGAAAPEPFPVLKVRGLRVCFRMASGLRRAVDGASFELRPGEILGLTGPSGSGKSTVARAILGIVRGRPGVIAGQIRLGERDLLAMLDRMCMVNEERGCLRVGKDSERWRRQLRRNYPASVRGGMAGLFLAASIGVGVWLSTRLHYRFLEGAELKEAGMMGDVWPLGARRAMCRWTSPSGNTRSRGMFTR